MYNPPKIDVRLLLGCRHLRFTSEEIFDVDHGEERYPCQLGDLRI